MSSDKTVKVTLTLRKSVADKLRKMCHNRGLTASLLIDSWIFEHDENGRPNKTGLETNNSFDQLMGILFRGK